MRIPETGSWQRRGRDVVLDLQQCRCGGTCDGGLDGEVEGERHSQAYLFRHRLLPVLRRTPPEQQQQVYERWVRAMDGWSSLPLPLRPGTPASGAYLGSVGKALVFTPSGDLYLGSVKDPRQLQWGPDGRWSVDLARLERLPALPLLPVHRRPRRQGEVEEREVPRVKGQRRRPPTVHLASVKPATWSADRALRDLGTHHATHRVPERGGRVGVATYDDRGRVVLTVYSADDYATPLWRGPLGRLRMSTLGAPYGTAQAGRAAERRILPLLSRATGQSTWRKHPAATGPDYVPKERPRAY